MVIPIKTDTEAAGMFSQKLTFFDFFFVFVLIIYSGRANVYVTTDSFTENPIGMLIPVLLGGILALRWNVKLDGRFFLLIFGFAVYFIAISIKYTDIQPTFFIKYLFIFFIVYTAVKSLKTDLFKIYELVVFYLAIIALIFWGIQTGLGGDTLYYIFRSIPDIDIYSYVSGDGLNAFLYSVQPTYTSIRYGFLPRNSGYTWEPGAFAVYLCLALFINLFFTTSDKNHKIRFWVLLIALISTQSTTGYLIFMVITVFYYFNKRLNIVLLVFPLVIIGLIYLSTLPFMSQKVIELVEETKGIELLVERTIGREEEMTPQRFTSFIITFTDFRDNPLLGLGNHVEDSWTYKIGANVSSISGIGDLLAQFGLVGFLFFFILTYKTSSFFARHFDYNGAPLLFIIILFISVSYSILFLPLVMCFWMYYLFKPIEKTVELKDIQEA